MYGILSRIIVLTGLLCLAGMPASAHAIVVQAAPAAGSVTAGPDIDIVLSYNVRIDAARSKLSLTSPDGTQREIAIATDTAPEKLHGTATGLAPGEYTLHWQVLATDGHITRGDIPFSIAP